MRRRLLLITVVTWLGCTSSGPAPEATSEDAPDAGAEELGPIAALVECNAATLGQMCDTDDEVCTLELCELVDGTPTCVRSGTASDGTVCESDGDGCTVDTCRDAACVHDPAPWCPIEDGE